MKAQAKTDAAASLVLWNGPLDGLRVRLPRTDECVYTVKAAGSLPVGRHLYARSATGRYVFVRTLEGGAR